MLILGATGGIGKAIAQKANNYDTKLVLVARDHDNLDNLKEEINDCLIISKDITKENNMAEIIKMTLEKYGKIDVLVQCVGSILLKPLHALKKEEFEKTLDKNLVSSFMAMKHVGMIKSAAVKYASRNIRINAIALGLVDTPLSKRVKLTSSKKAREAPKKLHPLGKIGKPKDIVDLVMFLAWEKSSWMTGAIIPMDGGMAAG